jgi:hypothetical protein
MVCVWAGYPHDFLGVPLLQIATALQSARATDLRVRRETARTGASHSAICTVHTRSTHVHRCTGQQSAAEKKEDERRALDGCVLCRFVSGHMPSVILGARMIAMSSPRMVICSMNGLVFRLGRSPSALPVGLAGPSVALVCCANRKST